VYKRCVHDESADQAAIDACLAGNVEAFAPLVSRYQEVAFRTAYLIVRDADSAKDVAQEAFVRTYRGLRRFERGSSFRPWLLRIVTNVALNEIRGRNRQGNLVQRIIPFAGTSGPPPDRAVEQNEFQGEVWEAVNALPENDRIVLYLRHYLELPEAEIAAVIGKRPGTVKSRLSRASARLREVIERDHPALIPQTARPGVHHD
jgi:RNA polymerase sigma-70 factor (ECF subfamily)